MIDIKPNNKHGSKSKSRNHDHSHKESKKDRHSTGLVTKFGGTIVKEGVTTVHETQVLGTYISGKYAQVIKQFKNEYKKKNCLHISKLRFFVFQVLQSTSRIVGKPKIAPTQTTKILKTAAPNLSKNKVHLEPTPAGSLHEETALPLEALFHGDKSNNLIRPSRRPGTFNLTNEIKNLKGYKLF